MVLIMRSLSVGCVRIVLQTLPVEYGLSADYVGAMAKTFIDAEASAKSIKAGLWADKDPIPPWEWRRAQRKN